MRNYFIPTDADFVNVIYASKTSESTLTVHIYSMVLLLLVEPNVGNSNNLMTIW
jgi:hypothetical protein